MNVPIILSNYKYASLLSLKHANKSLTFTLLDGFPDLSEFHKGVEGLSNSNHGVRHCSPYSSEVCFCKSSLTELINLSGLVKTEGEVVSTLLYLN